MPISGYLALGTAISGGAVVPPPSGAGYARQPISYDTFAGGVALNGVSCVFGPATAPWGTLTVFGVEDTDGNPVQPPGTLQVPFTPLVGQLVTVPQGALSLVVGSQFTAGPTAPLPQSGPTASGSVTLSSGAYVQVLASGTRNMLLLTNTDGSHSARIILGGSSAPASGAGGWSPLPSGGTWPPSSMSDFVPNDTIWALGGAQGQVLNYITG